MKNKQNTNSPFVDGHYLTDGGLETTLVFHYGIELRHFAAFELLTHSEGRKTLQKYMTPYVDLARKYELNFVLDTPTWRANSDWGFKLGYSERELQQINRDAVAFAQEQKHAFSNSSTHIVLCGEVGPRGDGYVVEHLMTPAQAKKYHEPQIRALVEGGIDVINALTINYSNEGIGVVLAAKDHGVPVVISFTVETDGHLPGGETLKEAIEKTDRMTDGYTTHFMINCAHPEHFGHRLKESGDWKNRISGIRANASTKSHAELDESEILDTGDKCRLAGGFRELMQLLPGLKVIGGCCGSDHSHHEIICETLFSQRKRNN